MAKMVTPDGVELDYISRGRGRTILFIHGWLCSQRVWDCQFHALQKDYRCVAFDLRGMGHSEKGDCAHTFDEFSADVRHLVDALKLHDVTLVGWSMGVSVALEYMARYHGDGRVSRVVLLNGPIKLLNTPDWNHGIERDECMGYIDGLVKEPIDGRRSFAAANLLNPSDAEVDFMFDLSMQTPLDVAIKAVTHQLQLDHRPALSALKVPCLAMQSDHDFYPVELGRYIADTAPKGSLAVFEDAGHCVQLQNAPLFNRALCDFISA